MKVKGRRKVRERVIGGRKVEQVLEGFMLKVSFRKSHDKIMVKNKERGWTCALTFFPCGVKESVLESPLSLRFHFSRPATVGMAWHGMAPNPMESCRTWAIADYIISPVSGVKKLFNIVLLFLISFLTVCLQLLRMIILTSAICLKIRNYLGVLNWLGTYFRWSHVAHLFNL